MNAPKELPPSLWASSHHDRLRQTIQAALDECLAPHAGQAAAPVDYRRLMQALGQRGLPGTGFPAQQSEQGADLALLAECLGTAPSLSIGTVLAAQLGLVAPLIARLGTPEQAERFLQPLRAGQLLVSCALAGSAPAKALRDAGGWRLHGRMERVLLARGADLHLVAARVEDGALLYFLVPAGGGGVCATEPPQPPTAAIGAGVGALELNDVRVEDACCLGADPAGLPQEILSALRINRMTRQCLDRIIAYLHERKINGESLIQLAVLQHRLAALECDYAMTRALAYQALSACLDVAATAAGSPACMLLAARLLRRVAQEALQLGGVAHYRSDSAIARFYTDAVAYGALIEPDCATLDRVAAAPGPERGLAIADSSFAASLDGWIAQNITPNTQRWLAEGNVPQRALIRSLADAGLMNRGWDAPHGDGDIGKQLYLHYRLAQQPNGAIGLCLASHIDISARFLASKAPAALATRWLPGALRGELILALAMTEPDSGSDLQGIEFNAAKTDAGWRLNGIKRGITNLPFADAAIVLVRTRAGRSPFSYALFLVPLDAPGVTREAALPTLGYEGCLGGLAARDVMLSDEHLIGPAGGGLITLMQHLVTERLFVSARMLGSAEYVFAQIRDSGADPRTVAELGARLQAFQAYFALCLDNLPSRLGARDSAMLKYSGSRLLKALTDSYLVHGGAAACRHGHAAERCHREALGLALAGGSEEIMLSLIGREL